MGPNNCLHSGTPFTPRVSHAQQGAALELRCSHVFAAEGLESAGNEHFPLLHLLSQPCIIFPLASLDRFVTIPLH